MLKAILFHIFQELKSPPTVVSTEGGEATAASWKWYDNHLLIQGAAVGSSPSQKGPDVECQGGTPYDHFTLINHLLNITDHQ